MLDTMLLGGAEMFEEITVYLLHMDHMQGLAREVNDHMDIFEEELEQMSIEQEGSWIPDPKWRILGKFALLTAQFAKEKKLIAQMQEEDKQ